MTEIHTSLLIRTKTTFVIITVMGFHLFCNVVADSVDDGVLVRSPPITRGNHIVTTMRIIPTYSSWKANMKKYLETLFTQLMEHDQNAIVCVMNKYNRFQTSSAIPIRSRKSNSRHANAMNEIEKLFEPSGFFEDFSIQNAKVYVDTLNLLESYAESNRIEDFEEIVFVLTIIINCPNICRMQTR
jgi:hypothetical protein